MIVNGIELEEKRKSLNEIDITYDGKVLTTIDFEKEILPQVEKLHKLINLLFKK